MESVRAADQREEWIECFPSTMFEAMLYSMCGKSEDMTKGMVSSRAYCIADSCLKAPDPAAIVPVLSYVMPPYDEPPDNTASSPYAARVFEP